MSAESSQTSLRTHLHNFALSTSVRGIPRAVKADSKVLSVLWLTAVFSCSCILAYYVRNTLSKYLNYDLVTNIKEAADNAVTYASEHSIVN